MAFAAAMGTTWAVTGALIRVQAPIWAVVTGLGAAAVFAFAITLAVTLGNALYCNRVCRAVRGGNREAASLCAGHLRRDRGGRDEEALFADDPSTPVLASLQRDLEWAGVKASAAEIRQYLAISRWAGAGHSRGAAGTRPGRAGRGYRMSRVRTAAAGF
jgi:hypothetical protein